jgi:hypothetical protein
MEQRFDLFNIATSSDVDEQEALIDFYKRFGLQAEYFKTLTTFMVRLGQEANLERLRSYLSELLKDLPQVPAQGLFSNKGKLG